MPDLRSESSFDRVSSSITDAEVLDVDVDDEAFADEAERMARREHHDDPPPDPGALERSIRRRRRELVGHLHELERVVRAKLDVRTRVRHGSERAMARLEVALDHLLERVRARPVPYLIVGGLMVWMLLGRRRTYRY